MPFGHPFEGYFLPYPAQSFAGLVSTITHEAPIMNWVFVHARTHELKFGPRAASEGNATGPWDCTRQDRRLTFAGWEGFCAVPEGDFWALYFDRDGDGLKGKLSPGTPVVEIELLRVEMRVAKPVAVELSEEEKVRESARKEAEAREMAERAAAVKAQEEMLRECIRRAQEEADKAQTEGLGDEEDEKGDGEQHRNLLQHAPPEGPKPQHSPTPKEQGEAPALGKNHEGRPERGRKGAGESLSPITSASTRLHSAERTSKNRNDTGGKPKPSLARQGGRNSYDVGGRNGLDPNGTPGCAKGSTRHGLGSERDGNANGRAALWDSTNSEGSGSSPHSNGSSPPSTHPSDDELLPSPELD